MTPLRVDIPGLVLKRGLNSREHYMARARRVKQERGKVKYRLSKVDRPGALLVVTLTRIAPRRLDDDQAVGALKSVRDEVAAWLGVDDRTTLVRWVYRQEKGPVGVRVEVRELSHAERMADEDAPWLKALGESIARLGEEPPRPDLFPVHPRDLPGRLAPRPVSAQEVRDSRAAEAHDRALADALRQVRGRPRDFRELARPATYRPGGKR